MQNVLYKYLRLRKVCNEIKFTGKSKFVAMYIFKSR